MPLRLSKMLSRSNCILILVMSNLTNSAPLRSQKRLPNESEQGFSTSPRILEIQLPLKIASKEDLIAWSKYVMSLVTSKDNFTSTNAKDTSAVGTQHEKQVSLVSNSASKSKDPMKKGSLTDKRLGLNYPARRLKGPHVQRPDDKVIAYPLPIGGMKNAMSKPPDSFSISSMINGQIDQRINPQYEQYTNFNNNNLFQQSYTNTFGNLDVLAQQDISRPANMYLPVPTSKTPDVVKYQNSQNISNLENPKAKYQTSNSFDLRIKALNDEIGQPLPINVSNGLNKKNLSRGNEALLTFPFQALITITREIPTDAKTSKTQSNFIVQAKDPNGFPPGFEKNYTVSNKAGQISVVFNDVTDTNNKIKDEEQVEEGEENENERETKNGKKRKSRKRQSTTFGDLLRTLGILRRPPKNTTEISVATPITSILKGTNSQKIQVAFEEMFLPNRERRNETDEVSEAQEAEEINDDDDEEEEEEGSIQGLIELLPLAAPILEDLSDPNSDTNIPELLQSALPLIQGFSDPNEEGGIDIPGILVPLSQKLSEGEEGESDSGAILGPIIQLTAPLIGPIVGPLIGPLSRTISGPGGKQQFINLLTQLTGTLSQPGPDGHSPLSNIIASITSGLSKAAADSAGNSDVTALVSTVVSGLLAGTSSGLSQSKNQGGKTRPYGQNDTYYAPTNYGSYGPYYDTRPQSTVNIKSVISDAMKQILTAVLKLSAASSSSGAQLSASSSSSSASMSATSSEGSLDSSHPQQTPVYGVPPPYSQPVRPTYYSSTRSPYTSIFTRRQVKAIKKI